MLILLLLSCTLPVPCDVYWHGLTVEPVAPMVLSSVSSSVSDEPPTLVIDVSLTDGSDSGVKAPTTAAIVLEGSVVDGFGMVEEQTVDTPRLCPGATAVAVFSLEIPDSWSPDMASGFPAVDVESDRRPAGVIDLWFGMTIRAPGW